MKNDILVIVYKFPPMGGIGTRRWTKFSKFLSKRGYKVHILTAEYNYYDKQNWIGDIKNNKNIFIYKFKTLYPLWLLKESDNKFIKQIKRYCNFALKRLFFYIDIAQYDYKSILFKAKEILDRYDIVNVIASGHPVSINYFSTYLKIDNPNINLIQDFRDNWNDLNIYRFGGKNGYNIFSRKEKSAYEEFFTHFYSDKVINVSEDLTKRLQNKHKSLSNKFLTITNGFDKDDYAGVERMSESFDMIYAGSLFNGRIDAIYLILDAIILLNDEYINENLKIVVYSNYGTNRIDKKYQKLINKNIFFKELVEPEEVISQIAKFSFCLSINSKFASYAYGTKIFDYMALNKKIVHISNGGSLFMFLKERKQFVSDYNIENIKNMLLNMKKSYLKGDIGSEIDYSDFDLEKLTLKLEELFV